MNSSVLNDENDPGMDSNPSEINALFAKDVFGFSLDYYQNDYTAISGATPLANVQNTSHAAQNSADLYNGNIRYMQTALTNPLDRANMPMLNAYKYDQLNRLKESRSYESGLSGNTCATINIWPPSTTPIPIQVVVKDNSNNVVASGFYTTAGNYSLAFTPTTPEATYTLEFYMPNASSLCFFRVDNVLVSYLEETVVETEGPGYVVRGGYRYGYQGSEKDDEIKGRGNSYTTHFR